MKNNAIETEYKGYRFRSRTEARWAVFFDTLGIRWEYELQGYRVGVRQVKYLPDFYMPEWDKFVEIKALKNIELSEVEKAGLLVQYEGKPVLMLLGQPWPGEYATRLIIPLLPYRKSVRLSAHSTGADGSVKLHRHTFAFALRVS